MLYDIPMLLPRPWFRFDIMHFISGERREITFEKEAIDYQLSHTCNAVGCIELSFFLNSFATVRLLRPRHGAVLLCADASKNTGYLPLLTKVLWRLMLSLRYMYPSLARCRPNLSQCALGTLQHQARCLDSVSLSARPALFSYETWVATRPGHYSKRQNKLPCTPSGI